MYSRVTLDMTRSSASDGSTASRSSQSRGRLLIDCSRYRYHFLAGQEERRRVRKISAPVHGRALTEIDPRKARVIELRFLGGLSVEETAEVLKVSPDTVMRDWRLARAWLLAEMSRGS